MDKPLSLKSARKLQIRYNLPISRTSKFWKGLEEGTALPLSAFATEELLRNAFEANVPIFVVDNDGQILWKLVFDSSNEKIVVKK